MDPSSNGSRLLAKSLSGTLCRRVEFHTLDEQHVVKRINVSRSRPPVHVEPHGRDVGDTTPQKYVRQVGGWTRSVVGRQTGVEDGVFDLKAREHSGGILRLF